MEKTKYFICEKKKRGKHVRKYTNCEDKAHEDKLDILWVEVKRKPKS